MNSPNLFYGLFSRVTSVRGSVQHSSVNSSAQKQSYVQHIYQQQQYSQSIMYSTTASGSSSGYSYYSSSISAPNAYGGAPGTGHPMGIDSNIIRQPMYYSGYAPPPSFNQETGLNYGYPKSQISHQSSQIQITQNLSQQQAYLAQQTQMNLSQDSNISPRIYSVPQTQQHLYCQSQQDSKSSDETQQQVMLGHNLQTSHLIDDVMGVSIHNVKQQSHLVSSSKLANRSMIQTFFTPSEIEKFANYKKIFLTSNDDERKHFIENLSEGDYKSFNDYMDFESGKKQSLFGLLNQNNVNDSHNLSSFSLGSRSSSCLNSVAQFEIFKKSNSLDPTSYFKDFYKNKGETSSQSTQVKKTSVFTKIIDSSKRNRFGNSINQSQKSSLCSNQQNSNSIQSQESNVSDSYLSKELSLNEELMNIQNHYDYQCNELQKIESQSREMGFVHYKTAYQDIQKKVEDLRKNMSILERQIEECHQNNVHIQAPVNSGLKRKQGCDEQDDDTGIKKAHTSKNDQNRPNLYVVNPRRSSSMSAAKKVNKRPVFDRLGPIQLENSKGYSNLIKNINIKPTSTNNNHHHYGQRYSGQNLGNAISLTGRSDSREIVNQSNIGNRDSPLVSGQSPRSIQQFSPRSDDNKFVLPSSKQKKQQQIQKSQTSGKPGSVQQNENTGNPGMGIALGVKKIVQPKKKVNISNKKKVLNFTRSSNKDVMPPNQAKNKNLVHNPDKNKAFPPPTTGLNKQTLINHTEQKNSNQNLTQQYFYKENSTNQAKSVASTQSKNKVSTSQTKSNSVQMDMTNKTAHVLKDSQSKKMSQSSEISQASSFNQVLLSTPALLPTPYHDGYSNQATSKFTHSKDSQQVINDQIKNFYHSSDKAILDHLLSKDPKILSRNQRRKLKRLQGIFNQKNDDKPQPNGAEVKKNKMIDKNIGKTHENDSENINKNIPKNLLEIKPEFFKDHQNLRTSQKSLNSDGQLEKNSKIDFSESGNYFIKAQNGKMLTNQRSSFPSRIKSNNDNIVERIQKPHFIQFEIPKKCSEKTKKTSPTKIKKVLISKKHSEMEDVSETNEPLETISQKAEIKIFNSVGKVNILETNERLLESKAVARICSKEDIKNVLKPTKKTSESLLKKSISEEGNIESLNKSGKSLNNNSEFSQKVSDSLKRTSDMIKKFSEPMKKVLEFSKKISESSKKVGEDRESYERKISVLNGQSLSKRCRSSDKEFLSLSDSDFDNVLEFFEYCPLCNVIIDTQEEFYAHFHCEMHTDKLRASDLAMLKKAQDKLFERSIGRDGQLSDIYLNSDGEIPVGSKGTEFIYPTQSFYCDLCAEFMLSKKHCDLHVKGRRHLSLYKKFSSKNKQHEERFFSKKKSLFKATQYYHMARKYKEKGYNLIDSLKRKFVPINQNIIKQFKMKKRTENQFSEIRENDDVEKIVEKILDDLIKKIHLESITKLNSFMYDFYDDKVEVEKPFNKKMLIDMKMLVKGTNIERTEEIKCKDNMRDYKKMDNEKSTEAKIKHEKKVLKENYENLNIKKTLEHVLDEYDNDDGNDDDGNDDDGNDDDGNDDDGKDDDGNDDEEYNNEDYDDEEYEIVNEMVTTKSEQTPEIDQDHIGSDEFEDEEEEEEYCVIDGNQPIESKVEEERSFIINEDIIIKDNAGIKFEIVSSEHQSKLDLIASQQELNDEEMQDFMDVLQVFEDEKHLFQIDGMNDDEEFVNNILNDDNIFKNDNINDIQIEPEVVINNSCINKDEEVMDAIDEIHSDSLSCSSSSRYVSEEDEFEVVDEAC